MKRVLGWLLLLILLGVAIAVFYVWRQGPTYRPPPEAPADVPPPPAATAPPPETHYPVPETDAPLPPLARSDGPVLAALSEVFGNGVRRFLQPQEVARRIVVTIDNLPRQNMSGQLQPHKPVTGRLRTQGQGEDLRLDDANYERYRPYVKLMESVDAATFAAAYQKFYPLFQQTYRELGYPKQHFNDRLVTVIDHLLKAPSLDEAPELEQPHVFYKFADPELESLSVGHKLMIRMGNANAERVKAKLREIRTELTKNGPQPAPRK
ncbi:DUF3014 domain-containing protein [Noviherbaspirillum aridicola]|uniref:DUF3014 family protein n=1 Tax=Noviherbaspirillum aridicola TaxID=2849687 RepID=A0ABQ4Q3L7_9BURK|nr:DUF3014 domain-containing protein [Noviherbaspirillum aridicola]GIZ51385.1 hypothetical protein NCCP691_13990 [Noviherbaspirillum aridicola]